YKSRYGNNTPPNFCMVLRKHLTGATLVGVEQAPGERIVDFVFSCIDEVGTASMKILTAEIMGRHSNLIFWEKESKKILVSSHVVTKDMSRQREVLPNLQYQRPPGQERPNIFSLERSVLKARIAALKEQADPKPKEEYPVAEVESQSQSQSQSQTQNQTDKPRPATLEQWLLTEFTGLGKHLCEEIIAGTTLPSRISEALAEPDLEKKLWEKLSFVQETDKYNALMTTELDKYTLLGWYPDCADQTKWTSFTTVNDLVESYFRALEAREHYIQLREKIKAEINTESTKLLARQKIAQEHMGAEIEMEELKTYGHMILSNLHKIEPGQTDLEVDNWSESNGDSVTIKLNPHLNGRQNAQSYYTRYAKVRARKNAASGTLAEVENRLSILDNMKSTAENAKDIGELRKLKDTLSGRKHQEKGKKSAVENKPKSKQRILNFRSSDGWTIYVGRNRNENDVLLSKIANPNDLWLHVL
ncbi:MAG: NFACT family protein, partial [Candidatus Obscuribacterales bacterium]|nr:NFACT family protein [Candidatus Obscuribacterales bacterium]